MSGRADPAVRADDDLQRATRAQRRSHRLAVLGLLAAAVAVPVVVDAYVRPPGALIGALVAAALFVGLAVAAWPWAWSDDELDHHRLEAIWREARTDADTAVPWARHAAWAAADGEHVLLLRLTCAPSTDPAPRRLRIEVAVRLDASSIVEAAEAMEDLRGTCEDREHAARQAHDDALILRERRAGDAELTAIDAAAAREQRSAEAAMRREVEAEEAAERRAAAAALAEALRRP